MKESRGQLFLLILGSVFYPVTEKWLAPWGLTVDYPFLLLFWVAMRRGPAPGAFYGFFLGLFRDLTSFAQLGATALAFSISGYLIGDMREKIDRDNLLIRLVILLLAYLLAQALFLPPSLGWSPAAAFMAWLRYSLPGSLLNALAYFLTLLIVRAAKEGLALLHEPADR